METKEGRSVTPDTPRIIAVMLGLLLITPIGLSDHLPAWYAIFSGAGAVLLAWAFYRVIREIRDAVAR